MLNPLEEKILSYLIEHKDDGEYTGIVFPDEKLADVCVAVKDLKKDDDKVCLYLISASARLTPDGRYYFETRGKQKSNVTEKFYHLLVVTEKNEKIVKTDVVDISDVIELVVIPYLREEEFYVDGFVLNKKIIKRIKIGVTEKSAQEIANYKNETMPKNVWMIVSASDIVEYSDFTTDITEKIISKAKCLIAEEIENLQRKIKWIIQEYFLFTVEIMN